MTDNRVREAGRCLAETWSAARPMDICPQPVRAGSVVRARFASPGATDIAVIG